jgi:hypothetical protein
MTIPRWSLSATSCLCQLMIAFVGTLGSPQTSYATGEGTASSAVKAAFLYNFAKFAEWPADSIAPGGPLIACTNDTAVADSLSQLLKGHDVNGRTVEVRRISADSVQLRTCHVLYLWNLNAAQSRRVIDALSGAAVLTVSDFNRFAALGGVVQFIDENGRLRFAINLAAMRRQRLKLSSKLLALASIVEDEPTAD